jgi:hypothetical protein
MNTQEKRINSNILFALEMSRKKETKDLAEIMADFQPMPELDEIVLLYQKSDKRTRKQIRQLFNELTGIDMTTWMVKAVKRFQTQKDENEYDVLQSAYNTLRPTRFVPDCLAILTLWFAQPNHYQFEAVFEQLTNRKFTELVDLATEVLIEAPYNDYDAEEDTEADAYGEDIDGSEFSTLVNYVYQTEAWDEIACGIACGLWTAYCVHTNLTADKEEYKNRLNRLYGAYMDSQPDEPVSRDEFAADMSKYLR